MLADLVTPVSIYLKLRDKYANSILLESSDYHGDENSYSYICCNPIATFTVKNQKLDIANPDGQVVSKVLDTPKQAIQELHTFMNSFENDENEFKFITNGLFGYMAYDAVQYFEDITFSTIKKDEYKIPDIIYSVYRNIIVVDHIKNEMYVFDHHLSGDASESNASEIVDLVKSKNYPDYRFEWSDDETSNLTDKEYIDIVTKGKNHCFRG